MATKLQGIYPHPKGILGDTSVRALTSWLISKKTALSILQGSGRAERVAEQPWHASTQRHTKICCENAKEDSFF